MSAVALGCSHTAGTGLTPNENYVSILSQDLGLEIVNLGVPSGNHSQVQINLVKHLQNHRPKFVILQWPNPFRITTWSENVSKKETAQNGGPIYSAMIKSGDRNFLEPWFQSIVVSNQICLEAKIPTVNMLLENVDQEWHDRLRQYNIVLHVDEKLPGKTWLFDSAASDGLHHSTHCHRQWAQRLKQLL